MIYGSIAAKPPQLDIMGQLLVQYLSNSTQTQKKNVKTTPAIAMKIAKSKAFG